MDTGTIIITVVSVAVGLPGAILSVFLLKDRWKWRQNGKNHDRHLF